MSRDVFARVRDLNAADRERPVWRPACSGEGDRPYTVTRRTPGGSLPREYDQTASGRLRHYTLEGAVDRSEELNGGVS